MKNEKMKKVFFFTRWMLYIFKDLMLSTVKSSQRNTNQKAGETPESVRKGQRSHRKKRRGNRRTEQMEGENDLNLQWVSWDSWESFGKYLKIICRLSWRVSDTTWGSHEVAKTGSICVILLLKVVTFDEWTNIHECSLWTYILPWDLNFRGDNSFLHDRLGH